MTITVGVFSGYHRRADFLLNHAAQSWGREGRFRFVPNQRDADIIFVFTEPCWPKQEGLMSYWQRHYHRLKGDYFEAKTHISYQWLNTPKDKTFVLMYEPPPIAQRLVPVASQYARIVWTPDERFPNAVRMPAWWMIYDELQTLRDDRPQEEAVELVAVTTGKTTLPGHEERHRFLRALRDAGVPLRVFGWDAPADLKPLGQVESKGAVMKGAKLTLSLENYAEGGLYVSEKLWDPLLCWSVPIYHGSTAADGMIPADAMIRLPNLGPEGVEMVRAAIADPNTRTRRLDAMAQARRQVFDQHRLLKWLTDRFTELGF
jgi:hypothetical protein